MTDDGSKVYLNHHVDGGGLPQRSRVEYAIVGGVVLLGVYRIVALGEWGNAVTDFVLAFLFWMNHRFYQRGWRQGHAAAVDSLIEQLVDHVDDVEVDHD